MDSFRWLISLIQDSWADLNDRVSMDTQKQMNREDDTMRQRIENINKNKQSSLQIETQVPTNKITLETDFEKENSNVSLV